MINLHCFKPLNLCYVTVMAARKTNPSVNRLVHNVKLLSNSPTSILSYKENYMGDQMKKTTWSIRSYVLLLTKIS